MKGASTAGWYNQGEVTQLPSLGERGPGTLLAVGTVPCSPGVKRAEAENRLERPVARRGAAGLERTGCSDAEKMVHKFQK